MQADRPLPLPAPVLVALLTLAVAAPALAAAAAPGPGPAERAKVLQSLMDCRRITGDADRLSCFDRATAALDEAEKTGDVVVVDKAQVTAVKRQAFGLSLPSLSLFRGSGAAAVHDDQIKQVDLTIDGVRFGASGHFVLHTTEGATWVQTDGVLDFPPQAGQALVVTPGMLGSYFCKVNGQSKVRCKREN